VVPDGLLRPLSARRHTAPPTVRPANIAHRSPNDLFDAKLLLLLKCAPRPPPVQNVLIYLFFPFLRSLVFESVSFFVCVAGG